MENTTNAPPWYREITTNTMGPLKFVTARPISAPYSSCQCRIDSGDPSNPDRFARTTSGRLPLAAVTARAVLRDACGKSVPDVQDGGPSAGTNPRRAIGRDSRPSMQTLIPPTRASQTTEFSPPRQRSQRSSGSLSWSVTERITERTSKGFLRSGLRSAENTSPTTVKSQSGTAACGKGLTSRLPGSAVGIRRGNRSPGVT